MKNIYICTILFLIITISTTYSQNVGINTDGSNPDGSAMLDVKSTTKGMLMPRMTTAERLLIASPATGLIVFDTTTKSYYFYNGTAWAEIRESKGIDDNDDNTKVYVTSTTDSIYFMVNGIIRMTVDINGIVQIGTGTSTSTLKMNSGTGQESSISLNSGTTGLKMSANDANPEVITIANTTATDPTKMLINSGTGQESSITLNSGTSGLKISTNDASTPEAISISNLDATNPTKMLINSGTGQESSITLKSGVTENYSIAADGTNLAVAVNGTDALVVEPAGNVGIGLANPDGTYALDVSGAIHSSDVIRSGNSIIIDGVNYQITTDNFIAFRVNSTEYMRLANAGNIGIGTTTPHSSAQLDITSNAKGLLIPRMTTVQRNAIGTPATGLLVFDTDVNGFFFFNGTVWSNITTANPPAGANNQIQFNNSGAFGANTNFVWDNTNLNVGIGTSTPDPTSALEISATNKGILIPRINKSIREGMTSPAIGLLVYQLDDQNGFWFYDGTWKNVSTKPAGFNNEIQFNNSNSFGSSSNFVWDNTNSRLGIGIASPTYNLEVVGSAKLNSLNINNVYSLPTTDGTNGQVMQTSGIGTITWTDVNAKKIDGVNINAPSPANGQVLSYNSAMLQWESLTLSPDYTGAGTSNSLTKWTGGNSFGNSIIQDDGTTLGVGIAPSASGKLVVDGASSTAVKGMYNANVYGSLGTVFYGVFGQYDANHYGGIGTGNSAISGAITAAATGVSYGGYFTNSSTAATSKYGLYSTITGAGGGTNYGIYATASGGGTNWAGYFVGNVAIGNTTASSELRIYEPTGGGTNYNAFKTIPQVNSYTYTLPATDGVAGQVLSTSGGTAPVLSWVTPATAYSGTGTLNYLTKWTGGNSFGNSQLFDNGTYVGIGTNSPASMLDVVNNSAQTILSLNGTANTGIILKTSGTNNWEIYHNNAQSALYFYSNSLLEAPFVIKNGGNIGIGALNPVSLLSIGNTSQFQINSSGNIVKLNNVTTSFPNANSSGFLSNDGAGNLSWATISGTLSGGTNNYLGRWTGANTMGLSAIQDDGTTLGIGIAPVGTIKFNISATGAENGLQVNSSGTGFAGFFYTPSASNSSYSLQARTDGTGNAGQFQINNVSNASSAIYATTNGSGDALIAYTSGAGKVINASTIGTGRAGEFKITNASNTNSALYAITNGQGAAIFGDQTASTGSVYGVYGTSASSSGVGIYGTSQLTGVEGYVSGTTSNSSGGKFYNGSTSAATHYGVNSAVAGNTGTGTKYGAYSSVSGTALSNYGLYATATGVATNSYGVYSSSVNTSTNNYGIYATASGGTNNFAGYFVGDIYVSAISNFNGDLKTNGAVYKKVRNAIGAITVQATDHIIICNNTATITLPTPAGNNGREIIIRSVTGAVVTVNTNAGANVLFKIISGTLSNTYQLPANGICTLICDGVYWYSLD